MTIGIVAVIVAFVFGHWFGRWTERKSWRKTLGVGLNESDQALCDRYVEQRKEKRYGNGMGEHTPI